jgi:sterol desaturase/sphingolipid hydroxylase (fatty acid hydroxylase superfamily)
MARNLPVEQPATRVIHYVDTATQADLTRYGQLDQAAILRKQQRDSELYRAWKFRQAEIRRRDRKFRRFWTGFGAVVALVFLAALFVGGWLLWQYLAALGFSALAIGFVILLFSGGLAIGGHRCITIVEHIH